MHVDRLDQYQQKNPRDQNKAQKEKGSRVQTWRGKYNYQRGHFDLEERDEDDIYCGLPD